MDIFKAIDSLNRGKKIRDIKAPIGVFLEKRNGKIISSNGYEGITLNTDSEYEIYEEKEPEFINKILILLDDLKQYTKKKCTYDCNKCGLYINNECIKNKIDNIANIRYKNQRDIGKIKPTIHTGIKDIEVEGFNFKKIPTDSKTLEFTFSPNSEEVMKRIVDQLTKDGFKMRGF